MNNPLNALSCMEQVTEYRQKSKPSLAPLDLRKIHNAGSRYFLIQAPSFEMVRKCISSGVWACPEYMQQPIDSARTLAKNVFLLFTVKSFPQFHGYARVINIVGRCTKLHEYSESELKGIYLTEIQWVHLHDLDFQILEDIYSYSMINYSNGEELPHVIGSTICRHIHGNGDLIIPAFTPKFEDPSSGEEIISEEIIEGGIGQLLQLKLQTTNDPIRIPLKRKNINSNYNNRDKKKLLNQSDQPVDHNSYKRDRRY